MSECVVRMEMPENCLCCPMVFTADVPGYHWCAALEQEVEQGLSRPSECPILCALPEGHGRLVDADAPSLRGGLKLIREAEYQVYGKDAWGFAAKCETAIEDAPTIVPAERSET